MCFIWFLFYFFNTINDNSKVFGLLEQYKLIKNSCIKEITLEYNLINFELNQTNVYKGNINMNIWIYKFYTYIAMGIFYLKWLQFNI